MFWVTAIYTPGFTSLVIKIEAVLRKTQQEMKTYCAWK